jgi:hypothetical protein
MTKKLFTWRLHIKFYHKTLLYKMPIHTKETKNHVSHLYDIYIAILRINYVKVHMLECWAV